MSLKAAQKLAKRQRALDETKEAEELAAAE